MANKAEYVTIRHWHVLLGMPGYIPNSVETYTDQQEAREAAAREYQLALEHQAELTDTELGVYPDEYFGILRGEVTLADLPDSTSETVEVTECNEPDCLEVDGWDRVPA